MVRLLYKYAKITRTLVGKLEPLHMNTRTLVEGTTCMTTLDVHALV